MAQLVIALEMVALADLTRRGAPPFPERRGNKEGGQLI
jgi:hypothetical protein